MKRCERNYIEQTRKLITERKEFYSNSENKAFILVRKALASLEMEFDELKKRHNIRY